MTLPDEVRGEIEAVLTQQSGTQVRLMSSSAVGGGCISPTARVQTDTGRSFFLKWGSQDLPATMLAAEARGLQTLRDAGEVQVPSVVGSGGRGPTSWLLLEWLEPGTAGRGAWERLGRELATLHRHSAPRFGADEDNYIGSLPQENTRSDSWAEFWRDRRLRPQLMEALSGGHLTADDEHRFETLFSRLTDHLGPIESEGPSLLHGDLWSGNVHMLTTGSAALIDPSVYHGHREVDLAMADLFGGFGHEFREGYEGEWPLEPGYEPARRSIYQLYYLLVHVNLFGAGYVGRTRSALGGAGV